MPTEMDARLREMAEKLNDLFQITLSAGINLQESWQGEPVPEELSDIQQAARRGAALTTELLKLVRSEGEGSVPDDQL